MIMIIRAESQQRDIYLDMDHLLVAVLLLWSSGVQSAENHNSTDPDDVRLVEQTHRCEGIVEVKKGQWRPVDFFDWSRKEADVFCKHLGCGSAFSIQWKNESSNRAAWKIHPKCVLSGSSLRECAMSFLSSLILNVTCTDMLVQPNISVSSMDRFSEDQQEEFQVSRGSNFTISCSIQPQYPGGSFQLTFTSSNTAHNYTQPAVNHSAHFPFPAAEPAHQGSYSCVYHVYVFSHNFSSESRPLALTVSDPTVFIIRLVLLLLSLLLFISAICFSHKVIRRQELNPQEDVELDG